MTTDYGPVRHRCVPADHARLALWQPRSCRRQIIDQYVLPGAAQEVNLPSRLRTATRSTPEQRISLLLEARREILLLLAFDPYVRFLRSKEYEEMIGELGAAPAAAASAASTDYRPAPAEGGQEGAFAGGDGSINFGGSSRHAPLRSGSFILRGPGLPDSWLRRFMRLADLLPLSVTVAEVRCGAGSLMHPAHRSLAWISFRFCRCACR